VQPSVRLRQTIVTYAGAVIVESMRDHDNICPYAKGEAVAG